MYRPFALPVLLVTVLSLATACGGSSTGRGGDQEPASYATDGTFTMAIAYDPGSFDPYRSFIFTRAGLAYDSLVNLQPDGTFVSGLAEEWTADAMSATFTLKPDITCSDGTPLSATDVATAIAYVSDPANQSPQYGLNTPTTPLTATGDDNTNSVKIMLEQPFGFLLHTIGLLPIVCPAGLANPEVLKTGSAGTGPFVLTEVIAGQSYTFTRRDGYTWGPDGASTSEPGTPATVAIRIVSNQTTAANLLLSGEVNHAEIGGRDRQRLDAQGLAKLNGPQVGSWLMFNEFGDRPTVDPQVRRALVHALDMDEVVQVITGGTGGPSTGLVSVEPNPCPGETVAGQLPEYDPDAAAALLDQAGWTRGADGSRTKDGTPLTVKLLSWSEDPTFSGTATAELLARKWEALGVTVTLSSEPSTALVQTLDENHDWDVYVASGGGNLPSQMATFFSGPVPPEGLNRAGIENAEYDELVSRARALVAPDSCAIWHEAEQALYRNVDVVPIAFNNLPTYLHGAEARETGLAQPIPTSIRVLD